MSKYSAPRMKRDPHWDLLIVTFQNPGNRQKLSEATERMREGKEGSINKGNEKEK